MIKRAAILFVAMLCCAGHAQTSNVETVKAWTRTHIVGIPGGKILDPTGTIADQQRLSSVAQMNVESSNLVLSAHDGFTNAVQRLYDAAPETNKFTGRVYIAMDVDDDPNYSNIWAAVVAEAADPDGTLHKFCHYSRLLSEPPKTLWEFDVAPDTTLWSDGIVNTNNALTNVLGYACYDIRVPRPAGVGNVVLRMNKFMKWGASAKPLNISDSGLAIVHGAATNYAYTGEVVYTNLPNVITETYLSGFLYKTTTNAVGSL